ncbi:MAG: hypothetical protein PWR13_373 [Archaeoglobi archaeon]|nr:DUF2209 family protein [Candidatus Mnemosynella bozhongmuii]MDI3502714.1 hypothetical protein [Archaeoglobi archaeon]MDK2781345.1 hypothetical protein [Archaeoglobi archaeon]
MAERLIAVDISGRHANEKGEYLMVCAAVEAKVTAYSILSVEKLSIKRKLLERAPEFSDIVEFIKETVNGMSAEVIVSEAGEFFNEPEWRVESILGRKVRYLESIGERRLQHLAHLITNEVRALLQEES